MKNQLNFCYYTSNKKSLFKEYIDLAKKYNIPFKNDWIGNVPYYGVLNGERACRLNQFTKNVFFTFEDLKSFIESNYDIEPFNWDNSKFGPLTYQEAIDIQEFLQKQYISPLDLNRTSKRDSNYIGVNRNKSGVYKTFDLFHKSKKVDRTGEILQIINKNKKNEVYSTDAEDRGSDQKREISFSRTKKQIANAKRLVGNETSCRITRAKIRRCPLSSNIISF